MRHEGEAPRASRGVARHSGKGFLKGEVSPDARIWEVTPTSDDTPLTPQRHETLSQLTVSCQLPGTAHDQLHTLFERVSVQLGNH